MSLRNFRMTVEYDGTDFCGWQTQAEGLRTVQEHVEEKLQRIFKTKVHCQASGRTDRGVHAIGQVVHFKVDTKFDVVLILKALSAFLDKDVSIVGLEEVGLDFHAQKCAIGKTYQYTILNRPYPSALWRNRAYFYPHSLNLTAMRQAAKFIKGTHDFKSFQSASERSKIKNTVRTISELSVVKEGDLIRITVSSDGFLYKMVRNIVGALVDVGSKRITPKDIAERLRAKKAILEPSTAPSHGLCLMSVNYK